VRPPAALLAVVAALALAPGGAAARVVRRPPPAPRPRVHDFWREVAEPHADEIALVIGKVRLAIAQAEQAQTGENDPLGAGQAKLLDDAYGMLRYARRLAPRAAPVLLLLGEVADDLGHTRQAREALRAYLELAGAPGAAASDPRGALEATGRLGLIAQRLGEDEAEHQLRAGLLPVDDPRQPTGLAGEVLIALAGELAARGDTGAAIELLASAVPVTTTSYGADATLATFALAVTYDRDEQRAAAFEVLTRLQGALGGSYGPMLAAALARVRFAPAADALYYQALLDESAGMLTEARAQWALYAASGAPRYRQRALGHVAAIDAIRATPAHRGPR
jgi:tetratricopeptide (TPR) repeat protein